MLTCFKCLTIGEDINEKLKSAFVMTVLENAILPTVKDEKTN
jgi:hypothetical protein